MSSTPLRTLCFLLVAASCACRSTPSSLPVTLRVLTYNIHHGEGRDGRLDLGRIADVIRAAEPDLVCLQEVDVGTRRTERMDQVARLSRLTGLRAAFGANLDYQGGKYGNAVLSRLGPIHVRNHRLPKRSAGEDRGLLELHFRYGGERIALFATHFDHRGAPDERIASAHFANALAVRADVPAILAGDLNAAPDSRPMAILADEWFDTAAHGGAAPTWPADAPRARIDYVLVRPAARFRVLEHRVLDERVASDHRPVLTVLELVRPR